MKKEVMVDEQQYRVIDGDITRDFTFRVFKGKAYRKAEWMNNVQVVEVKAFRIEVREQWNWDGQAFRHDFQDFGYITSRSGEFAHARRRIKECASLDEIRMLMADLEVDFRIALDKDAKRELKRVLGVHKLASPVIRTHKAYTPLAQIRLP